MFPRQDDILSLIMLVALLFNSPCRIPREFR